MKKALLFIALIAVLAIISTMGLIQCTLADDPKAQLPSPTEIKWDMEDHEKGPARRAWFAKLHQAEEGVSWEDIEYATSKKKHIEKVAKRKLLQKRSGEESFANGLVNGTWKERGSLNQAGSVLAMDYDAFNDQIYTIGDGGSLWKRSRTVNDWTLLNDDLRFRKRVLTLLPGESGISTIFSAVNNIPHYSEDDGASWFESAGIETSNGGTVSESEYTQNAAGENQLIALYRPGGGSYRLYLSKDNGRSFTELLNLQNGDSRNFTIEKIKKTGEIYFMEQVDANISRIWRWNTELENFEVVTEESPLGFGSGNARVNLEAAKIDESTTRFYVYDMDNNIQTSDDLGATWEIKGKLMDADNGSEERPWQVGIFVPEEAPNVVVSGAVDALRSTDGGATFRFINRWWEYYSDVENSMHADIMWMEDFTTKEGEPFLLINNHGGMYISYNNTGELTNISMSGLNVSQYYDVRTLPIDDNVVFAGSQDQGFQRGYIDGDGAQDFDQLISGDYGHIEFTDNGRSLWTVYPSGLIHFYRDAEFDPSITAGIQLPKANPTAWIAPIIADPDPNVNIVYASGGSMIQGDNGNYLIKLEFKNGDIVGENMPFDFSPYGEITAMEMDPFDENIWYVATDNGRFLISRDRGMSFTTEASGIPDGHYLYGADILVSTIDPNLILVSGSGYSTAGVRMSTNGGDTFRSAITDLPRTMVFGLAFNDDESLVFAATEAGPYVYVMEEEKWYDITGVDVPNQTYWSVEYLPNSNIVRYGTYGRGVWDFELSNTPVYNKELADLEGFEFSIYPNPSSNEINIDVEGDIDAISIFNTAGAQILSPPPTKRQINIEEWTSGTYHISILKDGKRSTSSFIKQ